MKVAVTATGPGLDAQMDERFGRAFGFVIVDDENSGTAEQFVENVDNQKRAQGAGITAAETVAKKGVKALLTGFVGPKAFRALSAAGIDVYTGNRGTVKEILDDFLAGKLTKASQADVQGHW